MKKLNNEYVLVLFLLSFVSILTAVDLFKDFSEGNSLFHLLIEASVILTCLFSIVLFLRKLIEEKHSLTASLDETREDLNYWKKKSSNLINGLSFEIDNQFKNWHLSKSEKEIALLLIKGFSTKEIANIRKTSEKTVRVQTSSIYKKTKLANRNELSAFFLEDLLLPLSSE